MATKKLPYFSPDKDFHLNCGIIILIISKLATTSRGKCILNNEQLLNFYYLIKKPLLMNRVLKSFGKTPVELSDSEFYSVDSLSLNAEPLFDRDRIRFLLKSISVYGYLTVEFRKADGFMYLLTPQGKKVADNLTSGFFEQTRKYLDHLSKIQSQSQHSLAKIINESFRHG